MQFDGIATSSVWPFANEWELPIVPHVRVDTSTVYDHASTDMATHLRIPAGTSNGAIGKDDLGPSRALLRSRLTRRLSHIGYPIRHIRRGRSMSVHAR